MGDQPDDLLNPDEIEALLDSADEHAAPSNSQPPQAGVPSAEAEMLDPQEIEALLARRDSGEGSSAATGSSSRSFDSTEELLERAEADLQAAVSPHLKRGIPPELGEAMPFQFEAFDGQSRAIEPALPLQALEDVELDLRIELGRAEMLIDEVLKLKEGSVVPLDKLAGDPVDILVNGQLVARGEVLVLNDNFCVRVAEILTPDF